MYQMAYKKNRNICFYGLETRKNQETREFKIKIQCLVRTHFKIRAPGWLSWLSVRLGFRSGQNLIGPIGPEVGLHTQQGACLRFSPSAPPSPTCMPSCMCSLFEIKVNLNEFIDLFHYSHNVRINLKGTTPNQIRNNSLNL